MVHPLPSFTVSYRPLPSGTGVLHAPFPWLIPQRPGRAFHPLRESRSFADFPPGRAKNKSPHHVAGTGWGEREDRVIASLAHNLRARQLQALVRRLHCESCERSVLSPYLQQRNLVIDQDETVRDLNRATRELAAESCSHRHGGLVLDSVQRRYGILVLGLRVLLPGLYRVQTTNCATLIVHYRVCGKAIR